MEVTPDFKQHLFLRKRVDGDSWAQIYADHPNMPPSSLRRLECEYRREMDIKLREPSAKVEAVTVAEDRIDAAQVWRKAVAVSKRRAQREEKRQQASVKFEGGPVCIVMMADLHIGSSGVDYARIESEVEQIKRTPSTWIGLVGDLADNMIVGRLAQIRAVSGEFTMSEEWAMVAHFMQMVGDRVLFSVAGNHDLWSLSSGVDQLKALHQSLNPDCIYHKYKQLLTVDVDGNQTILQARHKWRWSSVFNPTHGIEVTRNRDRAQPFDVGIGAHTHVSGLAREFNNGARSGLAVLCGAYKRLDDYADMLGVPAANNATAVAVIFEDDGSVWGTGNLNAALGYMRAVY